MTLTALWTLPSQLTERYPDNPASFAFEGEMHLIGGNLTRADDAYEKALKLGPMKKSRVALLPDQTPAGCDGRGTSID